MDATMVVAGLVVFAGAVLQGTIGFGLNIVAGPILALLDPSLVPVPVLMVATALGVILSIRERTAIDWSGVGWAMVGRVPGNVLGVLALAVLPAAGFSVAIGVTVLLCVGMSLLTWRPHPTRRSLVVAGTASGAFGTATSLGGPPMALLYQHRPGPTVRSTLAVFFLVASISSLVTLAISGDLVAAHLTAALTLLPFMALGAAVSTPLRRHLRGRGLRTAVLVVASLSAVVLIVHNL